MNKIKVIFFGTPKFAVPALKTLHKSKDFDIVAVVTQPDKPVGRKKELTPPPVKAYAEENNLKVLQPNTLSLRAERSNLEIATSHKVGTRDDNIIDEFKRLNPDIAVVVAYGKIIPNGILDIPRYGFANIHPSLLPKYRGPSPLQNTILNGDSVAGVSIMLLDEEMDHGPILTADRLKLTGNETYESLGEKLFDLGAKHLPEVLIKYVSGKLIPHEQEHSQATITKIIKKQDGLIDWTKPAEHIERMTRAYHPWPGAFGQLTTNNLQLTAKIIKAHVSPSVISSEVEKSHLVNPPGTSIVTEKKELGVICGDGILLIIDELQPSGKKKMDSKEYLRGHHQIMSPYPHKC